MGLTAKGGYPSQYIGSSSNLFIHFFFRYPFVSTPDEAEKFVAKQVAAGADYIKIFIEDGSCIGFPGLPVLDNENLLAGVKAAHGFDKVAIAHVTTAEEAKRAIVAGVDGLAHMFFDRQPTAEFVAAIASSGAFVIPTLVTISSALGNDASALVGDERVNSRLDQKWLDHLSRSINVYPQGKMADVLASVKALHRAGVDNILAGCDVSEPIPSLGGLAHGASLLSRTPIVGSSRIDTNRGAPGSHLDPRAWFGLTDRGQIIPSARVDLLLVDGDPTTNIADTLSIRSGWRRGILLATKRSAPVRATTDFTGRGRTESQEDLIPLHRKLGS